MRRTVGGIAAVLALAVVAFGVAYVGASALTKTPVAQATSGAAVKAASSGPALRAPELAVDTQPVALRTPTPKPKKKHTKRTATPKRTTTR